MKTLEQSRSIHQHNNNPFMWLLPHLRPSKPKDINPYNSQRQRGEMAAAAGSYFPVLQIRKLRHKWLPRCRAGITSIAGNVVINTFSMNSPYHNRLCAKSLQLCLTLCDSMDCSLPGSSVHGILQARILEWVAIPFSRGLNLSPLRCRRILYR